MKALVPGILGIEALLALLFVPIVVRSGHGPQGARIVAAASLTVGFAIAASLASRNRRTAVVLGTVLQLALIACGVIAWPMYVLGVLFLALWYSGLRTTRSDHDHRSR